MSFTVSVFSLEELIVTNPWPAVVSLALLFPAYGLIWKILFFLCTWPGRSPEGFIGSWLLSCRFLLFWLCFFYCAEYVLDTVAYTTIQKSLAPLSLMDKQYKNEMKNCVKDLSFRSEPHGPELVWYDAPKLSYCISHIQGKNRLGDDWEPENKSVLSYIDELFNALSKPEQ